MASDGRSTQHAFVTLLTSDHYLPGALVLAESIRLSHGIPRRGKRRAASASASQPPFQVVALITPETLSVQSVKALRRSGLFDWIIGVEPIGFRQILASDTAASSSQPDKPPILEAELDAKVLQMEKNLSLLGRPDLTNTLTKLHAWRLGRDSKDTVGNLAASPSSGSTWQGFDKVVFLDADTLVLRPIDHLFKLDSDPHFAAAPDTGWPDSFNSGVMLLKPAQSTFEAIRQFARTTGSWDGADQGLLNDFFGSEIGLSDSTGPDEGAAPGGGWKRLSFRYNVTSHGGYTFAPAYQRYGSSINIVHFIGQHKPWNRPRPSGSADPNPLTGPSDLGSHAITPDQSDYLLALWHSAFASLYPSSGTTSPDSEIEIVHTERGVEVVERRRFTVPTYHAVWDASAYEEDLATALGTNKDPNQADAREASYASLPLDGRSSLIAPVPRVPSPPTPTQASIDAEMRKAQQQAAQQQFEREEAESSKPAAPISIPGSDRMAKQQANKDEDDDGYVSPERFSPPKWSWNPAYEPPPSGNDASLYQMRTPIDAFYANAWDEAGSRPKTLAEQKAAFFVPKQASQHGGRHAGGPGYIPPKLRRDNVFENLGSHKPDPSKIKPVFPWETNQQAGAGPTRVFPDEPRPSPPPPSSSRSAAAPSSQSDEASGQHRQHASQTSVAERRRGLPHNLAYTNAWDMEGAIGNFANFWTKHTNPPSPVNRRQVRQQRSIEDQRSGASDRSSRRTGEPRRPDPINVPAASSHQHPYSQSFGDRRTASFEDRSEGPEGEASDSRDGDDESSSGGEDSDAEADTSKQVQEQTESSPSSSRTPTWPREGPGKGYMRKAENSFLNQMNATPRSPRMGSRVLSYSTANESASGGGGGTGEGRSGGRFSSSSSTSNSTLTGEAAAARQRAKDRIRPEGWVSPTGSFNSPPRNTYTSGAASLRGIPGASSGGNGNGGSGGGTGLLARSRPPSYVGDTNYIGRRRETNSSNDSQSASGGSGANSPTALLSPTLGHLSGSAATLFSSGTSATLQVSPSTAPKVPKPPSLDEPFSSSPVNSRSELSQRARTYQQAAWARRPHQNEPRDR